MKIVLPLLKTLLSTMSIMMLLVVTSHAQSTRSHLNIKSYEFIERVGFMETNRILEATKLFVPDDCHRVWDGKSALGDYVTKRGSEKVAIRLTKDICDDWANDLVLLFNSYGYQAASDIFKAPGFSKHAWDSPQYRSAKSRASALKASSQNSGNVYSNLMGSGPKTRAAKQTTSRYCFWKPIAAQQYYPDFSVINRLSEVKNWYQDAQPSRVKSFNLNGTIVPNAYRKVQCRAIPVR